MHCIGIQLKDQCTCIKNKQNIKIHNLYQHTLFHSHKTRMTSKNASKAICLYLTEKSIQKIVNYVQILRLNFRIEKPPSNVSLLICRDKV